MSTDEKRTLHRPELEKMLSSIRRISNDAEAREIDARLFAIFDGRRVRRAEKTVGWFKEDPCGSEATIEGWIYECPISEFAYHDEKGAFHREEASVEHVDKSGNSKTLIMIEELPFYTSTFEDAIKLSNFIVSEYSLQVSQHFEACDTHYDARFVKADGTGSSGSDLICAKAIVIAALRLLLTQRDASWAFRVASTGQDAVQTSM